jgi:phosphorylase/glycogen(starch) synthase
LEKTIKSNETILVYLLVLGGHTDIIPSLQCEQPSLFCDHLKSDAGPPPIATHRLHYEASDPILQTCSRLGLKNTPQNKVFVIFVPAYLNGHDGLINMTYYEALSGCDLGVFPSYYEPWGYTPLESAAYGIPTITTDQAGFGLWVAQQIGSTGGVILLQRRGKAIAVIEDNLYDILDEFLNWTEVEILERRKMARYAAEQANWAEFFNAHRKAYEQALAVSAERRAQQILIEERAEQKRVFAGTVSTQPHFRAFTAVVSIPENISRLRELAYNLWWAWNPRALDVFATLGSKLWEEVGKNPIKMLESVTPEMLVEAAESSSFLALYDQVLKQFDEYMGEVRESAGRFSSMEIKYSAPVAYFSTEYGLHETIPIYSGGLGTLAGDHLKTASDLNILLVGVGLLYKNGFFKQVIDNNGIQLAEYPDNDFSAMPVQLVQDDRGNAVQISLELPGRILFADIWEIKVGKVSLYLLNTDVPMNTPQDRRITDRLYSADQRTRIEQEILLGIGGVRLLTKLGIKPSLYHINEGHSAFLIFERIFVLMRDEGLSFDEASEVVRGSIVFTTHTPVEAGHERFTKDLMEYYFSTFVKRCGLSWPQFWELGCIESGDDKPFFMTVLALKMAFRSNAVSRLHGNISRRMWRNIWKGFHDTDVPIGYITNGVHTMSYIAPRMKDLLDIYLRMDWWKELANKERWVRAQKIPDAVLWRTRNELKQKTVDFLVENVSKNWAKFGYSKKWREELLAKLNPSALFIGFGRRFAPYKRADLLLSDLDRLDRVLNDKNRPVHVIMAGKSHPNDEMGKNILKKVIDACKDERFRGKLFFIEDYNIRVTRHLVQGVDVWLNTPRRPHEASGTSGEKVVVNGVINFSVSDGWWCEGYDGTNGWTIGPVVKDRPDNRPNADEEDAQSLYSLLENTIIPLFYERSESGIPEKWVAIIKRSMQTLGPMFNTERMLTEYYDQMYLPAATREQELTAGSYKLAKELADWKLKIPMRFSSVKLLDVTVEGIYGDTVHVGQPIVVNARIDPGRLAPEEILAELLLGRAEGSDFIEAPQCITLEISGKEDGVLIFSAQYEVKQNGLYSYGIRVMPHHKNLASKHETGLILWG